MGIHGEECSNIYLGCSRYIKLERLGGERMAKKGLPPETSLDDVLVRIREAYRNPSVGKIEQVTL